jgi:hypothetical protein
MLKKKIWANFQRIIELLTQKFVTKLSKIWVWDPTSGIRKKPILDPGFGSRGQKGTGSGCRSRAASKQKVRPGYGSASKQCQTAVLISSNYFFSFQVEIFSYHESQAVKSVLFLFCSNTTWCRPRHCSPATSWRRRMSSGQTCSRACPSPSGRWGLIR